MPSLLHLFQDGSAHRIDAAHKGSIVSGKGRGGKADQIDHAHALKEMDNASIALVHAITLVMTD